MQDEVVLRKVLLRCYRFIPSDLAPLHGRKDRDDLCGQAPALDGAEKSEAQRANVPLSSQSPLTRGQMRGSGGCREGHHLHCSLTADRVY